MPRARPRPPHRPARSDPEPKVLTIAEALEEPIVGTPALPVPIIGIAVVVAPVPVLAHRQVECDQLSDAGIAQEVGPLHVGIAVEPRLRRQRHLSRGGASY